MSITEFVTIPSIFCPLSQAINPHVQAARQHVLAWVQQSGLVQRETARQRFIRADFGGFAALTYPYVGVDDLALVSDWFAWLFLVDDQLDDGSLGIQPEKAKKVTEDLLAVMESTGTFGTAFVEASPSAMVASFADLCRRTYPQTQSAWRQRFRSHFASCFAAAYWEAQNRIQGVIPGVDTYIEKRRDTGAIYICLDLIDVVTRIDLPVQIYNHPAFQTLIDTASNVICWSNDIYSLKKEMEHDEYHNLVLILQHQNGSTLQRAIDDACDLTAREMQRFLEAERHIQGLFLLYAQDIEIYVEGIKSWMRGNLDWSSATKRYIDVEKTGSRETVNYLDMIL